MCTQNHFIRNGSRKRKLTQFQKTKNADVLFEKYEKWVTKNETKMVEHVERETGKLEAVEGTERPTVAKV